MPRFRMLRPAVARKGVWTLAVSLLAAITIVGLAATVGSFGARQFWWLELLTHFRLQLAVMLGACAIGLLLLGANGWAAMATLGSAFNLLLVGLLFVPVADHSRLDATQVKVLLANVRRQNQNHAAVVDLVREEEPEVLVLLEMDAAWLAGLASLEAAYPHRHAAPRDDDYGVAVFSRLPLERAATRPIGTEELPAILARVTTRGKPLSVLTAHPPPPKEAAMAAERNQQLGLLAQMAREAPPPAVLCGDLNVTPWTPYFVDVLRESGLLDARRGRGIQPTWPSFLPALARIPIDHCLVSPDLGVRDFRYGRDIGSDHRPVLLTVAVPAH